MQSSCKPTSSRFRPVAPLTEAAGAPNERRRRSLCTDSGHLLGIRKDARAAMKASAITEARCAGTRYARVSSPARSMINTRLSSLFVAALVVAGATLVLVDRTADETEPGNGGDHRNTEYVVNEQRIRLVDGVAETEVAPGSASRTVTRYFGNEVRHDLNGDVELDVVFLLTQETGGSGVFYYVVAALAAPDGFVGSHAVFLGDRIAPQTLEVRANDIIVVNYAERAPGESFAVAPSVGKSLWLKLDPETLQFGEVAQDFEGEADPATMQLDMKTWIWESARRSDGTEVKPRQPEAFTLRFDAGGGFSATTDCNQFTGGYTFDGASLRFSAIAATQMYCEGSQERDFSALLSDTVASHFTARGRLVLELAGAGGTASFR
jgi:heat shock protein HslJ